MAHNRVQQWATFARMWWIYDAKWQCPFRSAPVIIKHLHGQHKPIYHPTNDCGDHVVVINSRHIALEGEKWRTYKYSHHTGYPGGFSQTRAWKVHLNDPTKIIQKAVYGGTKGTLKRRLMMQRLHIYPDEDVPDNILANISGQIQQVMEVPRGIHEYTEEERAEFPAIFDWPKDHELVMGQRKPKS